MPPSRASANELGKLLGAVAEPLYVVGGAGRIVFVNDACLRWIAADAELVGQECRYNATGDLSGAAAVAGALCPPPEAFHGARIRAPVVLPGQVEATRREVDFIPLSLGADEPPAVLAIVSAAAHTESDAALHDLAGPQLHARLQAYRSRLTVRHHVDRLLGDSPAMRQVRSQVQLAAGNSVNVLVLGPSGSGREQVGRAIHYGDGRGATGPLVPLSCPLLDAELLQATLRTVVRPRPADERPATLLLNEIDALSEGGQTELFQSLASGHGTSRVISTSRLPLIEQAARGLFRADLAFLLSTLTISIPPLAQRMGDLPLAVQWYLEQANLRSAKQIGGCSPEALDRLADYRWPGDLAELETIVREAHDRAEGPLIVPQDLPPQLALAGKATARPAKPEETIVLETYLATIEHELIVRALKRAKGNKTKAARLLGMTRPRFYRRLVQLGLAEG